MSSAHRRVAGQSAEQRSGGKGKRWLALAFAGVLLFSIAGAASVATFGGSDLANAAVTRVKSVLELLNQRSPGRRTEGRLVKIKHKLAARRPHERALPKVRMALPLAPSVAPATLIDLIAAPPAVPKTLDKVPFGPIAENTPPGGPPYGPPPLIFPPGSPGEFPPTSPPVVSQPPPPPPPPPVPEPATWTTMLLGFGLIGWSFRRRRRLARIRPASC